MEKGAICEDRLFHFPERTPQGTWSTSVTPCVHNCGVIGGRTKSASNVKDNGAHTGNKTEVGDHRRRVGVTGYNGIQHRPRVFGRKRFRTRHRQLVARSLCFARSDSPPSWLRPSLPPQGVLSRPEPSTTWQVSPSRPLHCGKETQLHRPSVSY